MVCSMQSSGVLYNAKILRRQNLVRYSRAIVMSNSECRLMTKKGETGVNKMVNINIEVVFRHKALRSHQKRDNRASCSSKGEAARKTFWLAWTCLKKGQVANNLSSNGSDSQGEQMKRKTKNKMTEQNKSGFEGNEMSTQVTDVHDSIRSLLNMCYARTNQ